MLFFGARKVAPEGPFLLFYFCEKNTEKSVKTGGFTLLGAFPPKMAGGVLTPGDGHSDMLFGGVSGVSG